MANDVAKGGVLEALEETWKVVRCWVGIAALFVGLTLTALVAENVLKLAPPWVHDGVMLAGVLLFVAGLLTADYNYKALR